MRSAAPATFIKVTAKVRIQSAMLALNVAPHRTERAIDGGVAIN
jgi:hypothetical protein